VWLVLVVLVEIVQRALFANANRTVQLFISFLLGALLAGALEIAWRRARQRGA
jgi:hypothetical protein